MTEDFDEFQRIWNEFVFAKTLDEHDAAHRKLDTSHNPAYHYITKVWFPMKQRFVTCYINERHFGSSTTSRAEGSHHAIKSYIKIGVLNPWEVVNRLTLMWKNQVTALKFKVVGPWTQILGREIYFQIQIPNHTEKLID